MNIDRDVDQGGIDEAVHRINFCLNYFENMNDDNCKIFSQTIGPRLTVEEIIGALVSAEQALKENQEQNESV